MVVWGGGFGASKARACGAREENRRVAKVALVWMEFLEGFESGFLSRTFLAMRNFLVENVLGVGGERRVLVPKKLEESKG